MKRILKIFGYFLAVLLVILLGLLFYFFLNKDDISKSLLMSINKQTPGELRIEEVQLNPFVHFPNVSLTLREASFFERGENQQDSLEDQIFYLSRLHVSFDLVQLLKSRIDVVEVSAEEGSLQLIQRADSSLNLINALQTAKAPKASPNPMPSDTPVKDSQDLSLSIREIHIKNLDVDFVMEPAGLSQSVSIRRVLADFDYKSTFLQCQLKSRLNIRNLELNESLRLAGEELEAKIRFFYRPGSEELQIDQCDLHFLNAHLLVNGRMEFQQETKMDLSFEVSDHKLQFTRLFLTSEGIDQLKSGGLFLKGTAVGSLKGRIPEIKGSFGASDLRVQWPGSRKDDFRLSMDGFFTSGTVPDLSEAFLEIDTLSALLPDGYVRAAASLENLSEPEYYYHVDASLALDGLEEIIPLGPVRDLKGRITFRDEYRGLILEDGQHVDLCENPFYLQMDSLSFLLGDEFKADYLDGTLSGLSDSLELTELCLESEESALLCNGTIYKLSNFLYHKNRPVEADLSFQSEYLVFPQFFSFIPGFARNFPFTGKDLSISVNCETTYDQLFKFDRIPELRLEQVRISGSLDSIVPFMSMEQGRMELREAQNSAILEIHTVNVELEEYQAEISGALHLKAEKPDSVHFRLDTDGLNPTLLLENWMDSVPGILDAEFTGQIAGRLSGHEDSSIFLSSASLILDDFHYKGQDTLSVNKLNLQSRDIALNRQPGTNPLATLSASSSLEVEDLNSAAFQSESLALQFEIADGRYKILIPPNETIGRLDHGTIVLFPFEESPGFELIYRADDLALEDLLENFNREKLILGKVNVELDLHSRGSGLEEITSQISGKIILEGDSLVLEGLDLDELINKFRRSQSFNLLDITAIALAGPAGILYSKGSDYVQLLATKKGDRTSISQLSSNWILEEGKIQIEDVAFATLENRVALKGWLDMKTDSLDIVAGIINPDGCALIDQRIYGRSSEPELGKVKILKALLSPVTSLVDEVVNMDCEVFYEGRVKHPEQR